MGYACPVCGTPQTDARHLANHLAFTAMLHGEDHEAWLDEHAPDWETAGEAALASRVSDLADDADYPQVFEDTTGRTGTDHEHGHDHEHDPEGSPTVDPERARERGSGEMDAETRAVLAEARELTREMLADDGESEEDGGNGGNSGSGGPGRDGEATDGE